MPIGQYKDFDKVNEKIKLNYTTDFIVEKLTETDLKEKSLGSGNKKRIKIKGTAINETTTRNGVTYLAEELSVSANSLRNKPILKDHNNSIDSIVGRTTENVYFDINSKSVKF